jgi:hypothetical protein
MDFLKRVTRPRNISDLEHAILRAGLLFGPNASLDEMDRQMAKEHPVFQATRAITGGIEDPSCVLEGLEIETDRAELQGGIMDAWMGDNSD